MNLFKTALFLFATILSGSTNASRDDSWRITMDYSRVFFMDRFWFFHRAARRWAEVIVGDMSDRVGPANVNTPCGNYPSTIDDLWICAAYRNVDGKGGFIAASGATLVRSDEQWQPYAGLMIFDRKDLVWMRRRRNFRNYILREMGHVIGLTGLIWRLSGVAGDAAMDPPCPYYGSYATQEWQEISGCDNAVPTETEFPNTPSIQCNHWSSKCMPGEIMTADSHTIRQATISKVTLGSLQDMNFTVDYSMADPYTTDDLNPACTCPSRNLRRSTITEEPTDVSQLSETAMKDAIKIGKDILKTTTVDFPSPDNVSGQGVFVMYQEEDSVFTVLVTNDM